MNLETEAEAASETGMSDADWMDTQLAQFTKLASSGRFPAFAGVLAISAVYTGFNEGSSNWQSLWTCAIYLLLALTLWQARGVQTPK